MCHAVRGICHCHRTRSALQHNVHRANGRNGRKPEAQKSCEIVFCSAVCDFSVQKIPGTSSSYRMMFWGCLRFEMNVHKPFFLCGHSFQNELGFQRDSSSFGSGSSNRGESTLLAVVSKGGSAALAGGIQWRAAPLSGRKNPMKPAVSWHTTLRAKSSVLYLWRPWVAERGCSGQEQALSVSHRTGGFCVLPDEKPRNLR